VRVDTFRFLDRLLGIPACALFTAGRQLLPAAGGSTASVVRKILFIKLVEQGSTVLARPAFEAAAARVGRENVYCLTLEENRGILDLMRLIPDENVLAVPGDSPWRIFLGLVQAVRAVRRLRIDAVVDLEFFARTSAAIAFLTGARLRAGLHPGPGGGPWRGDLFTHNVLHQPDLHTSQLYEVLVRALDLPAGLLPTLPFPVPPRVSWHEPSFVPGVEDVRRVRLMIGNPGDDRARLFLLSPNAGDLMPLRQWSEARYLELARLLLDDYRESRIVLTGTTSEAAAIDALATRVSSPRCISLAGRTSLRDLLTLAALSDVLVSSDSGPVHFASLTAARIVALFGPEAPLRFGPLSASSEAISTGLACSPCLSAYNNRASSCRDNRCVQGITVEEVRAAVARALSRS
jgi:ADP-heptose:LPS heptosyltransferase